MEDMELLRRIYFTRRAILAKERESLVNQALRCISTSQHTVPLPGNSQVSNLSTQPVEHEGRSLLVVMATNFNMSSRLLSSPVSGIASATSVQLKQCPGFPDSNLFLLGL